MDIKEFQKQVWELKSDKGFNTTNVEREFNHLYGEVAEAHQAWEQEKPDFPGELADIANYVVSIAEMTGVNLDDAVKAKLEVIRSREYERQPNGRVIKLLPKDIEKGA